ncbi:C6 transcription factor [Aspergillus eucalypticola CBS 122712]|uniref:C6 transcription factor n=1 Tax=Aspergillus eucalypticola (strain CBS 122712 / IBT 29274) TaxID=1448314 RepID=A0A317VFK8_ASPEC|nr:C6 transcription factor [Aspergillus eucalypticola CBS 122712]PWY72675.1 C6 transcription factor [Aspergillus eucalypticola CBS 122712]
MQKASSRSTRSRISKACDRCRRQKLKCDSVRPCVLCTRAGHKCETTTASRRRVSEYQAPATPAASAGSDTPQVLPRRASEDHHQQYATGTSAIGFARQVYNEEETGRTLTEAAVPGDVGMMGADNSLWGLKETPMPPTTVMLALINAYFDRMQWFILVLHEPSFREMAQPIISQHQWQRRDLGAVMTVLAVAVISLQSVLPDADWPGHILLSRHSIDAQDLLNKFLTEIRSRVLDILEDRRIEGVQVCLLLCCYYMFHSSPNMAWTTCGMAFRAAYALNLQETSTSSQPSIANETRSRCWNQIIVSDTFCSILYGRPASLPSANVRHLQLVDDLVFDYSLLTNLSVENSDGITSRAPFHVLKTDVYAIAREILIRFRRLDLTSGLEEQNLEAIIHITEESNALLTDWWKAVPKLYDFDYWKADGRWETVEGQLQTLPPQARQQVETIYLQAAVLQLTYDGMVIQANRPLLERRINRLTSSRAIMDAMHRALDRATAAALRISCVPVHTLKNHFAIAVVSMTKFTAGVILCIPPTVKPLTATAHEAKDGVVRIIRASRSLKSHDRIARQTEQLLTELLKVTTQREITHALADNIETNCPSDTRLTGSGVDGRSNDSLSAGRSRTIHGPAVQAAVDTVQGSWDTEYNVPPAVMGPYDFLPAQAFQQLDDTFGAFGESMFNLVPDDQNSTWNWGRTFP